MVRAVQDQALAEGAAVGIVALYDGLVRTVDHLLGDGAAEIGGFSDDAVLQAAIAEVSPEDRTWMSNWILRNIDWIANASDVLDQLDQLVDPFPAIPAGADAYRRAAQELAHQEGEGCAAVAWAGGAAEARWMRLYGGREVDTGEIAAADAVLESARRKLADEEKLRIVGLVHEQWEQIDSMATETA